MAPFAITPGQPQTPPAQVACKCDVPSRRYVGAFRCIVYSRRRTYGGSSGGPDTKATAQDGGANRRGAAWRRWSFPAAALGKDGAVAPSERIVLGGLGIGGRGGE